MFLQDLLELIVKLRNQYVLKICMDQIVSNAYLWTHVKDIIPVTKILGPKSAEMVGRVNIAKREISVACGTLSVPSKLLTVDAGMVVPVSIRHAVVHQASLEVFVKRMTQSVPVILVRMVGLVRCRSTKETTPVYVYLVSPLVLRWS